MPDASGEGARIELPSYYEFEAVGLRIDLRYAPGGGAKVEGRLQDINYSGTPTELPPGVADGVGALGGIASLRGVAEASSDGRGEIRSGALSGELYLSWPFHDLYQFANCTFDDHSWSLRAR